MKKNRKNAGFTMLELIVVVAIIGILAGVAMINVTKYQRDLALKEADSAAKELFIAAQNHLTDADALGKLSQYRKPTNPNPTGEQVGTKDGSDYYIVYPGNYGIHEQMLPFGAIDETVRSGGSYIIHYNLDTATVLDVFYSDASDKRFGCDLTISDYNEEGGPNLKDNLPDSEGVDRKSVRRSVTLDDERKNRVIGWYGGEGLSKPDSYIDQPTVTVTNGDTLSVKTTVKKAPNGDSNRNPALSLIVAGESSGAMKQFELAGGDQLIDDGTDLFTQDTVLDDITDITGEDRHFKSVCKEGYNAKNPTLGFIPGENLIIRAMMYDNGVLSNIGESNRVRVNSLFGSIAKNDTASNQPGQVTISSFRHLENLDAEISGFDLNALKAQGVVTRDDALQAKQTSDLDWNTFMTGTAVYAAHKEIDPDYALNYKYQPVVSRKYQTTPESLARYTLDYQGGELVDGKKTSHRILNLTVTMGNSNAGLFDSLSDGSKVFDLDLVNFTVTGTSKAGALAGETDNTTLTNVKAYNDVTATTGKTDDSAFEISGSGSVGGLVGEFTGKADKCAAAVYVKSSTNSGLSGSAGGLFGAVGREETKKINDEEETIKIPGTVTNSYSGGHTVNGKYAVTTTAKDKDGHTVKTIKADGTVELNEDNKDNPVVSYTYTPDSDGVGRLNVQGDTAGGLIGTLDSGSTVTNCYSTCSASGTTVGGFVGTVGTVDTSESKGIIKNSYCTGLVAKDGTIYIKAASENVGLFVGNKIRGEFGSGEEANHYLEIVNYFDENIIKSESDKKVIPAVGSDSEDKSSVKPFDSNAEYYDEYVIAKGEEGKVLTVYAYPYDKKLAELSDKEEKTEEQTTYYIPKYSLRAIKHKDTKNGNEVDVLDQDTHYGDWPVYETYIVNTK